jgi:hypothetical protein
MNLKTFNRILDLSILTCIISEMIMIFTIVLLQSIFFIFFICITLDGSLIYSNYYIMKNTQPKLKLKLKLKLKSKSKLMEET